jgi:hypothetical protein
MIRNYPLGNRMSHLELHFSFTDVKMFLPLSFDRIWSNVSSSSISAARYWPVARCLKRNREFQWPAPPLHGSCWTTYGTALHVSLSNLYHTRWKIYIYVLFRSNQIYTVFFISFVVSSTCFRCFLYPSSEAQLLRAAIGCVSRERYPTKLISSFFCAY